MSMLPSHPRTSARTAARTLLPLAVAILVPACAVNPRQRPPDEISTTFALPIAASEHTIELRVANGRVTVLHAEVPSCDVVAHVRAASPTEARAMAADVELEPDAVADGVHVVAVRTPNPGSVESVNVSITVHAPPSVALRVLTRRATVDVHGYRGNLTVDTDSGDITARLDGGDAAIRSRSGGVRVSGMFDHATVRAEVGPVQVVLPGDATLPSVDVETQHGDVTLEVPQLSRVQFTARVRNAHSMPCELAAQWDEYGVDDGDRWKRFRGLIGAPSEPGHGSSTVSVVSESGRIAIRCLPGS